MCTDQIICLTWRQSSNSVRANTANFCFLSIYIQAQTYLGRCETSPLRQEPSLDHHVHLKDAEQNSPESAQLSLMVSLQQSKGSLKDVLALTSESVSGV
ncbi:hypothetical protein FGO68_gene12314 [Halteria grandinella]|uniref:Uncharacterized protein n=1 Tax=Halteria grandinella TaxID=5974 RepID=A0A8J8T1D1_HALGN|nr:hypothetical protein FGO68_gene12314 [Halteria grandinella]